MIIDFDNVLVFMLVLARMTGMLVIHPILGRNNVPTTANAALAFLLAVILSPNVAANLAADAGLLIFIYWVAKEVLLGVVASMITRLFLSILIVGGEIVDMQIGLSMAKAFDPGSNSSISISSQYFNALYILIFFLSDSHLTFLNMAASTLEIIPLGNYYLNMDAFYLIPDLFTNILLFGVKLSLPVVVVEIIVTFAVGIIMRIVPQINVFVVNIQFKLLVGMLVIVLLVPSFTAFMENVILIAADNIWNAWETMTTPV